MKKYFGVFLMISMATIFIFSTSCKKKNEVVHPYTIGQHYGGGIIFYIDASWQHGLICADKDQGNGIEWQLQPVFATNVKNTAIGTGQSNTTQLVSILGEGDYAAKLCDDLDLNGFSDWFLPSKDELSLMYTNLAGIGIGNFNTTMGIYYWSSSEIDYNDVWGQSFTQSAPWALPKLNHFPVRAIRAF